MYVQQCTQPTGTNQSIGLTSLPRQISRRSLSTNPTPIRLQAAPGAHTRLEIPVPFPNTAVKQPGPMIVLCAKVGQRRVILPSCFQRPLPSTTDQRTRVERPFPFPTARCPTAPFPTAPFRTAASGSRRNGTARCGSVSRLAPPRPTDARPRRAAPRRSRCRGRRRTRGPRGRRAPSARRCPRCASGRTWRRSSTGHCSGS